MYTNTIITENIDNIPNYIPFSKNTGISIEFDSEMGRPIIRRFYYDTHASQWRYYNGPLVYEISSMTKFNIKQISYNHDFNSVCNFDYVPNVI